MIIYFILRNKNMKIRKLLQKISHPMVFFLWLWKLRSPLNLTSIETPIQPTWILCLPCSRLLSVIIIFSPCLACSSHLLFHFFIQPTGKLRQKKSLTVVNTYNSLKTFLNRFTFEAHSELRHLFFDKSTWSLPKVLSQETSISKVITG